MADNQARYGFRWQRSLTGACSPPLIPARVASAYQAAPSAVNVDLWAGDPVKKVADGTVALCAAGDATYGIIAGFRPVDYAAPLGGIGFLDHLPGGSTGTVGTDKEMAAWIIPIDMQVFEVDVDDNVTFTTTAGYVGAIGENANISVNQVAADKKAYPKLAISGHATTNTLVWRIHGLSQRIDLDPTGLNYKLLVTGNVVQSAPFQTTGV